MRRRRVAATKAGLQRTACNQLAKCDGQEAGLHPTADPCSLPIQSPSTSQAFPTHTSHQPHLQVQGRGVLRQAQQGRVAKALLHCEAGDQHVALGHVRHLRLAAPTGGGRQELDKAGMCVSGCVCQCQCASIGARDTCVRGMPAAVSVVSLTPSQTPPCTTTLYQEQHRQAATHAPRPPSPTWHRRPAQSL